MTFIGIFGILSGLFGARFAMIERTRLRTSFFVIIYLFHLFATLAYYSFALNNITDASGYYHDPLHYYEDVGLGYGTLFVTYLVQSLKRLIGGTFLDYFLLAQAISFFAICVLMRVIEEIYLELEVRQPIYTYFLLLLPGLHFWTSPIGKDGFLLLGVSIAIWAAMNLRKRYLAMVAAVAIMLVIRPYVAPLCLAALGATIFFDRQTRLRFRILIVAGSLAGLGLAVTSVQQSFSVDVTDADSVSDWLAAHEEITRDAETAGNSAVYGSYPFKLLSLLFRPMFIDADNMMGMAASAENFIFLLLVATILARTRTTIQLARRLVFIRFTLIFGTMITLLLALTYFNIGLGLRQKTMFVPAFIIIFVTVSALLRARKEFPVGNWASAEPAPINEIESRPAIP